jgi:predicted RND superfamily exporter protein
MWKALVERLSDLQIRRPWVPILFVGAVTALFASFALRLELRTRYDQLLPDSQPSVQELRRVEARTASSQTALILLEDSDRATLRSMGDALAQKLLALGPGVVSSAETGTQDARAFLKPRAALFLDTAELERLRSDVKARWDYEVAKELGQLIDDTGPPVTSDDIEKRLRKDGGGSGDDLNSSGYYERKDGRALVVVVHSPVPGGDLEKTGIALHRIEAAVADLKASLPAFASVRVGYAGDMATGFIEYETIRNDLLGVGATGIALVLAAVLFYFMRLRALIIMGITIGVALIWTFGLTELVIGHLNVATGFLVSIVAGNGINVGILYQSRYFEERHHAVPVADALRKTVRATWQPTVIAALTSAAAYLSLLVTDFSAFRHFGFIAASGMLICWIVKTLLVPPLLLLSERRAPLDATSETGKLRVLTRRFEMGYGRVFSWLVPKAPTTFFVAGALLLAAGVVTGVRYVARDPMEYDLRATENDPLQNAELHRVWDGVIGILGAGHEGMVVLADTPDEARQTEAKLQADWDAAPVDGKPFAAVHSLWDMVPRDQETKIPILLSIRDRLEQARRRGFIADGDWTKLKDYLPSDELRPYGLADLPETIAHPYAEKDGQRGRLVVIEPEPSGSTDLRYLLKYSNSFRVTRLPSGKVVHGSGRAVIFADILQAVVHDIPRAVSLSLGLTLVAVLVAFRRARWHALTVVFALLLGVAGEIVFLNDFDVKINFLNFVALPITFGIGADYAINVVQRYRADGGGDILGALRTTGGAVVLCSLTTMLGYAALLRSHNRAIRSLGVIAVVGEVACLLAAVIVLPSLWLLLERRRRTAAATSREVQTVRPSILP